MNVLSLFDGMSCGQQALERSEIKVDKYFASEIDKFAIKVTMANYPNTIQLGSVVNVNGFDLPNIDLLIGGSPCQSFSFAGKRKGMATKDEVEILTLEHYLQLKNEGYEFEGQSYLFWEFMRLLNETKPKYFLLENVEMGEKWEKVLSKSIGVNGIHINSALVSAQSRKRIYWTNIGMKPAGLFGDLESVIQQPKDRGILLKDILETEVDEKYFLSEKLIKGFESHAINNTLEKNLENIDNGTFIDSYNQSINNEKSNAIRTTINSSNMNYVVDNKEEIISGQLRTFKNKEGFNENKSGKSFSILARARQDGSGQNVVIVHNIQQRSPNRPSLQKNKNAGGSGHLSKMDGKTYTLDTGNSNAIEIVAVRGRGEDNIPNIDGLNENQLKKFDTNIDSDKANTLTLAQGRAGSSTEYMDSVSKIAKITSNIRRLTPIECERLQTIPDNYTNHVSDSQRYKMLGNGWTVDVITHIFKYLQ